MSSLFSANPIFSEVTNSDAMSSSLPVTPFVGYTWQHLFNHVSSDGDIIINKALEDADKHFVATLLQLDVSEEPVTLINDRYVALGLKQRMALSRCQQCKRMFFARSLAVHTKNCGDIPIVNTRKVSSGSVVNKHIENRSQVSGLNGTTRKSSMKQLGNNKLSASTSLHYKKKVQLDLDRHCGVLTQPNNVPCFRSINCRSHSLQAKKNVPGRSKPFENLLSQFLRDRNLPPPVEGKRAHSSVSSSLAFKQNIKKFNNAIEPDPVVDGHDEELYNGLLSPLISTNPIDNNEEPIYDSIPRINDILLRLRSESFSGQLRREPISSSAFYHRSFRSAGTTSRFCRLDDLYRVAKASTLYFSSQNVVQKSLFRIFGTSFLTPSMLQSYQSSFYTNYSSAQQFSNIPPRRFPLTSVAPSLPALTVSSEAMGSLTDSTMSSNAVMTTAKKRKRKTPGAISTVTTGVDSQKTHAIPSLSHNPSEGTFGPVSHLNHPPSSVNPPARSSLLTSDTISSMPEISF